MSSKRVREEVDVKLPVIQLALDKIIVDETKNLRRFHPDQKAVEELADDIKGRGMINPVLVRVADSEGGTYELVAGYQRMKALAHLNATGNRIDSVNASVVTVMPTPMETKDGQEEEAQAKAQKSTENKVKLMNLAENLKRNELSYIDAAYAIKDLQDSGMTNVEIAKEFKKSGAWVTYIAKMLTLRAAIQNKIHEGKISFRTARTLPDLTEEEQDQAIAAESPEKTAQEAKKKKGRKSKRGRKAREDSAEGRNISSKQAILLVEELTVELEQAEGRKSKADENAVELYKSVVKFLSGAMGVKALHNRVMKLL